MSQNVGHGWVTPRPDGAKARCGGPGICPTCSREQVAAQAPATVPEPAQAPRGWVIEVCRTCDKLARFPFCEHRDQPAPPGFGSWLRTVYVIPEDPDER